MAVGKRDYRKELVDRVVALMEEADEWDRPWIPSVIRPHNPVTGTFYRGINMISLMSAGFDDDRFYTFNNIKKLSAEIEKEGGAPLRLRKGSVGTPIFKAVRINIDSKKENEDPESESDPAQKSKSFMVFAYAGTVFNGSQIENLPKPDASNKQEIDPVEKAEFAIRAMCEETGLSWKETRSSYASYRLRADEIVIPLRSQFKDITEFYSTALHELGHATGHPSRLNRESLQKTEMSSYAFEELVAEMTSLFTSVETGVPYNAKTHQNHAAYLKEWIFALKNNKNILFKACSQAAKASDYIARVANDYRAKISNDNVFGEQPVPDEFHTENDERFDFSDVLSEDDLPPDNLSSENAFEEFGIEIDQSFSRIDDEFNDGFRMGM